MNSMERVLTALQHQEPDRVPVFLALSMYGAKELGISIKQYFAKPENVVKGQLLMHKKYQADFLYSFHYASIETEAWGGEVIYSDDGPPNAGEPIIKKLDDINKLVVPDIKNSLCLKKILEATEGMKSEVGDTIPIIGVVMSPFSLPVMQLGFDKYFDTIYERTDLFEDLMKKNIEFTISWANAQLKAGATAICYFDPLSSTTIISKDVFLKTGYTVAQKTINRINGPIAMHMASGNCMSISNELASLGIAVIGVSNFEDLSVLKETFTNKVTVLGNLNGIEMRTWNASQTRENVKTAIIKGAKGGGFILSESHGEIAYQIKSETLLEITETVREFGKYPINWCH